MGVAYTSFPRLSEAAVPPRITSSHGRTREKRTLDAEVEVALCRRWHERHDVLAACQLIEAYAGLVVETVKAYRDLGFAAEELIGEGFVGLMRAVCRFDPDSPVRLSAYATWWVRAAIHECILRKRPLTSIDPSAPLVSC